MSTNKKWRKVEDSKPCFRRPRTFEGYYELYVLR